MDCPQSRASAKTGTVHLGRKHGLSPVEGERENGDSPPRENGDSPPEPLAKTGTVHLSRCFILEFESAWTRQTEDACRSNT